MGGGSRNDLWNRLRAEVTGLPVITVHHAEVTSIGAAMVAFVGAKIFTDLKEARGKIKFKEKVWEPSSLHSFYRELYQKYKDSLSSLPLIFQEEKPK